MIRINFGKGLFRLWAVLAVGWIAGSSFVVGRDLLRIQPNYEHMMSLGHQKLDYMIEQERRALMDKSVQPHSCPECEIPDWDGRALAAGIISLPPTILLLFGFAGLWIARGFRKTELPERL
jgi:hypothetical protein